MSTRYTLPQTCLTSGRVLASAEHVMLRTLEETMSFTLGSRHNQRSTGKTSLLHNGFAKTMVAGLGDFSDVFAKHYQISVERKEVGAKACRLNTGTENSDFFVVDKESGDIVLLVPLKGALFSLGKNVINTESNVRSNVQNLASYHTQALASAVTFMPSLDITRGELKEDFGKTLYTSRMTKDVKYSLKSGRLLDWLENSLKPEYATRMRLFYPKFDFACDFPRKGELQDIIDALQAQPFFLKNLDTSFLVSITEYLLQDMAKRHIYLAGEIKESHPELKV